MAGTTKKMSTVGEIARLSGCPLHRVEYIIRSRGIEPVGMAGNARVFSEADVGRVVAELQAGTDGRKP